MNYFLGIEVSRVTTGVILTQKKFTKKLLTECELDVSKVAKTPLPVSLKLRADDSPPFHDPALYRCLVGKLNFLTHTRPDLCYAVQTLSQYLHNPRMAHFKALHHLLRYVAYTAGQGIMIQSASNLILQGYSDSDWATCPDTRRSVTSFVMLLGQSPISWKSKK
ncbi:uncharacterized protein LOC110733681 [Chenopodium quinoa]|uniref:uncharacterized protein LOC110733681 n=1 Tax=Chenopodium quinoa TaxID=63459 RepID=UPI000B779FCD|nr:uncharacterized protein LOC110733681 [Chenopodium quinoa]